MPLQKAFLEYWDWVKAEQSKTCGTRIVTGAQPVVPAPFISIDVLRHYWQPERVREFLAPPHGGDRPATSLPVDSIIDGYLRIFATLVYISSEHRSRIFYLNRFSSMQYDDVHFPLRDKENLARFFTDPTDGKAMEEFYKHQFLFNPQELAHKSKLRLHRMELADSDILPITFVRDLNPNPDNTGGAKLKLFKADSTSGLVTKDQYLVAKIFPASEVPYSFESELTAYSALSRTDFAMRNAQYFLDYYGSFIQNGQGVILLEYADQGSLLEFFKRGDLPCTWDETFDLLNNFKNLFLGLAVLHSQEKSTTRTQRGIHQDIKPSNIFVFSVRSDSHYGFQFKIGDFGLSSFQHTSVEGHMSDNKSTKVYSAPELTSWNPGHDDHLDNGVTSGVDIWSMGCVLFETVVWGVCGMRGLNEFRDDRLEETQNQSNPSGCHGAFHNGTMRLEAIPNMADKLLPRLRVFDVLTKPLCKWICNDLLRHDPSVRLSASQAAYGMKGILSDAVKQHKMAHRLAHPSPKQAPPIPHHPSLGARESMGSMAPSNFSHEPIPSSLVPVKTPSQVPPTRWPLGSEVPTRPESSYQNPSDHQQYGHDRDFLTRNHTTGHWATANIDENLDRAGGMLANWGHERTTTKPQINSTDPHQTYNDHRWGPPGSNGSYPAPRPGRVTHSDVPSPIDDEKRVGAVRLSNCDIGPQQPQRQFSDAATIRPSRISDKRRPTHPEPSPSNTTLEKAPRTTIRDLIKRKRQGHRGLPNDLLDIPDVLKRRDQVFLIDNSAGMGRHWKDVQDTVEALFPIVAPIDPDGVEVRFTSTPTGSHKHKNAKELPQLFAANKPKDGHECMMQRALEVLIDDLVPPLSSSGPQRSTSMHFRSLFGRASSTKKTGISVYILTDAVWGGYGREKTWEGSRPYMCRVDETVETLVRRLQDRQEHSGYVTLQFIRFGRDRVGKQRLRYLDNELKETTGWDIVDRRYYARPVRPMLLGALNEHEDCQSDDSEDEDPVLAITS